MELPEDDQPPEEIWHHTERMKEWLESFKFKHSSRRGAEDADDVPMTRNELAKEFLDK